MDTDHLARHLKDNGRVLFAAYRGVEQAVREARAITPAREPLEAIEARIDLSDDAATHRVRVILGG